MRKSKWLKRVAALCTVLTAAGAAKAQTDVIVGDLYQVQNYGAVGSYITYGVGTYSCNQGPTRLTWIDGNAANLYPVISQNMYRLKDGRFEQVGQAWLKHGFCALNNMLCGSCPAVGPGPSGGHTCDHLDPGCADPYSAGLNATVGGLGPKHEVNPANATWPFPNSVGSTSSNNARLSARSADVLNQPATTLFFVSSTYFHPEDATNGTDNNNQSYRRVTVTPATGAIATAGTTFRESPAIYAWRDHGGGVGIADNSVILSNVDVAGDGRFIIGSKVIDLGGGQYRYEYAVQNFNSDRGASGFSVPMPASVTPSGFFFRDVDYLAGEPQTGTDWTPTVSGGNLAWNYANNQVQDRNENVLRYDTIYNFSFVASAAPVQGQATLTLFKTGTPTTVSGLAYIPGTGTPQPPFNNNCANALPASAGGTAFTTALATTDGPDACLFSGQTQIANDVWYTYTHTSTCLDPVVMTTCGSSFDTKLAVYTGTCGNPGTAIACNDDTAGCAGGTGTGLGSSVSFTPVQGQTYLVRVGAYPTATPDTGTGTLTITPGACAPLPPVNDLCANATWAAAGVTYTGSTANATTDGTASCVANSVDVWFKYRPVTTGSVNIRTCGSDFDTVLSVHSACGGTQLACNDDSAATCGTNSVQSALNVNMTAGTTYWIRIAGWQGAFGNYSLLITGGGGGVPPLNDDCAQRQGIAGTAIFNTTGASTDGPTTNNCGQVFNDIWYNYPSLCTGNLQIRMSGTGFTPKVAVYSGSTCGNESTREIGCGSATNNNIAVTVPVVAGQGYTIRIGSNANGTVGAGEISFTCVPAGPTCDSIDFNNDTSLFDPIDIDAFLSVYGEGPCVPANATCNDIDFNNDSSVFDPCDIDSFLLVFSEGPCTPCGQ
ncbi:MAG: hypothetical protein U0640_00155 [Phycisphaerales bacterium]